MREYRYRGAFIRAMEFAVIAQKRGAQNIVVYRQGDCATLIFDGSLTWAA